MSKLIFGSDIRVCKICDETFRLHEGMTEDDLFKCKKCGALGVLTVFPCAERKCNCGGWFSVAWENAYP